MLCVATAELSTVWTRHLGGHTAHDGRSPSSPLHHMVTSVPLLSLYLRDTGETEVNASPVQGHADSKRTWEEAGLAPSCCSELLQPGAQAPFMLVALTMVLQKPCPRPCASSSVGQRSLSVAIAEAQRASVYLSLLACDPYPLAAQGSQAMAKT